MNSGSSDSYVREDRLLVTIVIIIPPLIVWGLVSLVIVTVRWIRKGFAQAALILGSFLPS